MINVTYKDYKLTIEGHAGSAEYGHDLVCASATILFYTAIENLDQISERYKLVLDIRSESGDAYVKVLTRKPVEAVEDIFHIILIGYKVLEGMYPECVKVNWDA